MKKYIVLTENDESNWHDETGVLYHFPSRYKKYIESGVIALYYKGGIKNKEFASKRLLNEPHYFGVGVIDKVWKDLTSNKYFASIKNFVLFNEGVYFKNSSSEYLETKANIVTYNYFRDNAVRPITKVEYNDIIERSGALELMYFNSNEDYNAAHTSTVAEGGKKCYFVTKYERIKSYRDEALKIHGYNCAACDINFKDLYGQIGKGYIHIHHTKPLFSLQEVTVPDPKTDLIPVCPNCHAMIHRKKGSILTIQELKNLLNNSKAAQKK